MNRERKLTTTRLGARAIGCLLALGLAGAALNASPFGRLITFGDSLADTGNLYLNSGGALPPSPAYFDGRFSNGPIWTEYLAADLGVEIDDYAYGGAKTDNSNFNDGVPPFSYFPLIGLEQQVDLFLEDAVEERVDNRDLFVVVVGANDFFDYLTRDGEFPVPSAAWNTVHHIGRLLDAGARHVLVLNVPDLASTPAFASSPDEAKAGIRALLTAHNQYLAAGLAMLAGQYNSNILLIDTFTVINEFIADPAAYGLGNVYLPAQMFPVDPATSLFWDGVHPTTAGHRIIADQVIEAMLEHYVPGEAIGLDRQTPGWLNR